jgi:hypothetical protein
MQPQPEVSTIRAQEDLMLPNISIRVAVLPRQNYEAVHVVYSIQINRDAVW